MHARVASLAFVVASLLSSSASAAKLVLNFDTSTRAAGTEMTAVVEIRDPSSNALLSGDDTSEVTLSLVDLDGTGGVLLGNTVEGALAGVVSFEGVRVERSGRYQLRATSTGHTSATSGELIITNSGPASVHFLTQPHDHYSNAYLAEIAVEARDQFGNRCDTNPPWSYLELVDDTGAPVYALYAGGGYQDGGITRYTEVAVSLPGVGYRLRAYVNDTVETFSSSFDIEALQNARWHVTFTPSTPVAGEPFTITASLLDDDTGEVVAPRYDGNVRINHNWVGHNVTEDIPVTNGVATIGPFTVWQTGYLGVSVHSGGFSGGGASFVLNYATGTRLVFERQPYSNLAGSTYDPPIVVALVDANGDVVEGAEDAVALTNGPGGYGVDGDGNRRLVGGRAVFDDIHMNNTGSGLRLRAYLPNNGDVYVDSAPFNIVPSAPSQLALRNEYGGGYSANAVLAGCSPEVWVHSLDADGNPSPVLVDEPVLLDPDSPTRVFYEDENCTVQLEQLYIPQGESAVVFHYADPSREQPGVELQTSFATLRANLGVGDGYLQQPDGEVYVPAGRCSQAVVLDLIDPWRNPSPPSLLWPVEVLLSPNAGTMTLFRDAACLDALGPSMTLPAGERSVTFYARDTVAHDVFVYASTNPAAPQTGGRYVHVIPLTASDLVVTARPDTVTAGQSFTLTLETQKPDGAPYEEWAQSVTLQLVEKPEGASLEGTTSKVPEAGVVTFDDLVLRRDGVYRVRAYTGEGGYLEALVDLVVVPGPAVETHFLTPARAAFVTDCSDVLEVQGRDAEGNVITSSSVVNVALSSTNPSLSFYANPDCTTEVSEVPIPANGDRAAFYFKGTQVASPVVHAQYPGTPAEPQIQRVVSFQNAALFIDEAPVGARAGEPFSLVVSARRDGSTIDWPEDVTVSFGVAPLGAGLTGTTVKNGGNGVVTFDDLVVDRPGQYTFRASSLGLSVVSATVTIDPGPPAEVRYLTPSRVVQAGACSSPVTFALLDLSGAASPSDGSEAVTLGSASGTVQFYADALCSEGVDSVVLAEGESEGTFYFSDNFAGPTRVSVTTSGGVVAEQAHLVAASPEVEAPSALVFRTGDQEYLAGACSPENRVELADDTGDAVPAPVATEVALTSTSDTMRFYSDSSCNDEVTLIAVDVGSSQASFWARDDSLGAATVTASTLGLAPVSVQHLVSEATGPAPAALAFKSAPQVVATGACSQPVTVEVRDAEGAPLSLATAATVALVSDSPTLQVFSDDACTEAISDVQIDAGESEAWFWFSESVAGTPTLTATLAPLPEVSQRQTVTDVLPVAARLAFLTASHTVPSGACSPEVTVQLQDEGGAPAPATADVPLHVASSSPTAAFFADEACTFALTNARIALGQTQASFFFLDPLPGALSLTVDASGLEGDAQAHTVTDAGGAPPSILATANPFAAVGVAYAYDGDGRAEAGGTRPLTWSVGEGPDGFRVDAQTGLVTWKPSAAGAETITLVANNERGAGEYTFTVTVQEASEMEPPVASIALDPDPASGPAPLSVVVSGEESVTAEGTTPPFLRWDFGDGSLFALGAVQSHEYTVPGAYVVKLTVRDELGLSDVDSAVVAVADGDRYPPRARIVATVTPGEDAHEVALRCDCFAGSAPIASILWDLGDGTQSDAEEVTNIYGPGGYQVRLTVVDENGLAAIDSYEVRVDRGAEQPPIVLALASPSSGTPGVEVRYYAEFGDPDGEVTSVQWTFHDGSTSDQPEPTRTFDAPGLYAAELAVTDDDGLVSTRVVEVQVTSEEGALAPAIVSLPVKSATVGEVYRYNAAGKPSARGTRPLTWSLGKLVGGAREGAPAGMTIDAQTGALEWVPTAEQAASGDVSVVLVVENEAGSAVQEWRVALAGGGGEGEGEGEEPGCVCTAVDGEPERDAAPGWLALAFLGAAALRRRRRR